VPASQRYFAPGQLQFITSSVYCRVKLFDGPRPRGEFAEDDKRRASLCASHGFHPLPGLRAELHPQA
jgi:hypothetical protein